MIKLMEFLKIILSRRFNSPNNNMVILIISYTFLGFITYLLIMNFNIFDSLQIFISSIFSVSIYMYISDNFKLSNYKFIKFLQIFVFIFTIFGFIALILCLLFINIFDSVFSETPTIYSNSTDKPQQSSILSYLITNFENLEVVQKLSVSILLFNSALFSATISIFFIFYGDLLIARFDIENKYPKLGAIIRLRRKFQKYYLILNILTILSILTVESFFCLLIFLS